ncbi:MAG: LysR family transcriptional regulator [Bdellovibrionales bacterium]|nr:LysR family transcriptional regulator [Bdellovibrionales bacterium]
MSQTITSLEHSLGFPLFDRRGRRLIPTKEGLKIHQEFRRSQSAILQTLREIRGSQNEVSGMLRVGAYLEFAKSKLTVLLKEFIQDFPEANIKMVFDSPSRLNHLLDRGRLDLNLSIFPSFEKKAIRSQALCEEELVLISSAHLLPQNPTFEQILKASIIDYYFNHQPIRRWLQIQFNRRPKKIPIRIFASTAEMVVSLVREGAGIGVVPKYLVSSPETLKDLKIIRPSSKKMTDYIWLLERVGSEKSAVHAAFKSKLMNSFKPPIKLL